MIATVGQNRTNSIGARPGVSTDFCELLTTTRIVRTLVAALCVVLGLCSLVAVAQEVHVSSDHGAVTLSVAAEKPYTLMASGQPKTPVIAIVCQQKGKKMGHVITFSAGGILTEQEFSTFGNSASLLLTVRLGKQKLSTNWVAYGNVETFTYYGKTEQERLAFLHALLDAPSVTIEFTPFLTGAPTSITFDLTELRTEFDKHPECGAK